MSDPVAFYGTYLVPCLARWEAEPLALDLAMSLALNISHMADHYFHAHEAGSDELLGAITPGEFRSRLSDEDPTYSVLRDVCDAHKHFALDRTSAAVSSADQTGPGSMGYGEAEFGVGEFGSPEEIIVTLDDGTPRHFSALVREAIKSWELRLGINGN